MLALPAAAIPISITATASDRGSDVFPRDGVFDSVFSFTSAVNMQTPPLGNLGTEERGAVEFPLGSIPSGSVVLGATLLLTPTSTNIGLGAGEAGEVHGYSGDGAIQVGDLEQINLVGTIGPTDDGQISVPIDVTFVQSLIDGAAPFAGFMFKGADGPSPVVFGFLGTFSGIPVGERPTLVVDVQEPPVIPEPTTMLLLGSGLIAVRLRAILRGRKSQRSPIQ
jgi:hypothetical protein